MPQPACTQMYWKYDRLTKVMVYGYTESDVIAELRGWNEMSGDNDVVCVLWICVVVGNESYVCDQLPKLPEEPPPIGDCA